MQRPLQANLAAIHDLLGSRPEERRLDLPRRTSQTHATVDELLRAAGREYRERALHAQMQATIGSASAIVLLLAALGSFSFGLSGLRAKTIASTRQVVRRL